MMGVTRMFRSIVIPAIVIRRERLGEEHKALTLLTADRGLLSAVAWGAWKMRSRLATGSEPFTHCLVRLYHNPVKNTFKVTELEVRESFEGLRRDLDRITAASLWAEVCLRSIAAGELSAGLYRLLLDCLRLLERGTPAPYMTAQFLWRFLDLAGYRSDPCTCERCGRHLGDDEPARWVGAAGALRCAACAEPGAPPIGPGARRYLERTQAMGLEAAAAVTLDGASLAGLTAGLRAMIRDVLETDLKSLSAGAGGKRPPAGARR